MSWLYRHIAPSFREPITWGDLIAILIVISLLKVAA